MNVLRRQMAPLSADLWTMVDDEVRSTLQALLTARRVVDFAGPHGYETSSVSVGRLVGQAKENGLAYGIRQVQSLVEVKVDFDISLEELDNVMRGAKDVDLSAASAAARALAAFEEKLVYDGLEAGAVLGLAVAAERHKPPTADLALGSDPHSYVLVVSEALKSFSVRGIGGPFALVLGIEEYQNLASDVGPYSSLQRIQRLIDGPVLQSVHLNGGLIVSQRGGDFQLDVGQDVSVGYRSHDAKSVQLFLLETLTFRVFTPDAALRLL